MAFKNTKIDTLVIGAGQAGLATSRHLTVSGIPHMVIEKNRIAEQWRTGRWDSLVANGPAWHDKFPDLKFNDFNDNDFVPKDNIADYFVAYAKKYNMPIHTGISVDKVTRNEQESGFIVDTTNGTIYARHVVVATGAFQNPSIPPIVPNTAPAEQIHSSQYYNPEQLPNGNVLVVGAGSSGVQIADELNRAGKQVYLSVGPHERPPRSYRGRDFVWWLGVLGLWNLEATAPGTEHVTIAVTGKHGEHGNIDFRALAQDGINLVGLTHKYDNGTLSFNTDLGKNIRLGDEKLFELLDMADTYVVRNNLNLPEQPEMRQLLPDPECLTNPILDVNLNDANITAIIWATGFKSDYSWLQVDTFNDNGTPAHQRGVGKEAGIYFVGLPWQSRRGSSFIWGVWHDAKHIVDNIAFNHTYLNYHNSADKG